MTRNFAGKHSQKGATRRSAPWHSLAAEVSAITGHFTPTQRGARQQSRTQRFLRRWSTPCSASRTGASINTSASTRLRYGGAKTRGCECTRNRVASEPGNDPHIGTSHRVSNCLHDSPSPVNVFSLNTASRIFLLGSPATRFDPDLVDELRSEERSAWVASYDRCAPPTIVTDPVSGFGLNGGGFLQQSTAVPSSKTRAITVFRRTWWAGGHGPDSDQRRQAFARHDSRFRSEKRCTAIDDCHAADLTRR